MKEQTINIARGPWPADVAEQLAKHGILRWQILKRHYGARPEALTKVVPGTSTKDWIDWLNELPPVPERAERTYAMGLVPDRERPENDD